MRCKISSILKVLLVFSTILSCDQPKHKVISKPFKPADIPQKVVLENYVSKADEALKFCVANKMNTDFCILIDMKVHSGKKRFFVWDFKKNKITHRFLVGHGCGDDTWSGDQTKENPSFSNVEDSHRTSLGKYRIGARAHSDWGVHVKYLMHGLEDSNSNALKRFIVFHSWDAVSDEEIFPTGTPEGWGCPTVSNESFKIIDPMLQTSKKSALMWIFDSDTERYN